MINKRLTDHHGVLIRAKVRQPVTNEIVQRLSCLRGCHGVVERARISRRIRKVTLDKFNHLPGDPIRRKPQRLRDLCGGSRRQSFAVVGINRITLLRPARKSVTEVVVALAVQVNDPVLFSLPSRMLFTTWLISRGFVASVGSLRKLASAKSPALDVYALRKTPVSADTHSGPMESALHSMLAKPFVG